MSIRLEADDGRNIRISAWNWGVLHAVVAEAHLFDDAMWAPKRANAGGELDSEDVVRLADHLEREVLPMIGPGERMYMNGAVTSVPDDGTFYREESELWKNYSLRHDVLVEVIAFLRRTTGAVKFF